MFEKQIEKLIDKVTNGTRKDQKIKELWDALNDAVCALDVYGHMDLYEANPEWEPPVYLRDGEYTVEQRLADIRYNSIKLREAHDKAIKILLKGKLP